MNRFKLQNQKGASLSDYVITLVLLAALAWVVWKFWANPENRQSLHPAQDILGR